MRRALHAIAPALVALHLALRVLGAAEHTTFLTGTVTPTSAVVGPLYVVAYLGAVIVAPIVGAASLGELCVAYVRRRRELGGS
jgi:hypothetical protein